VGAPVQLRLSSAYVSTYGGQLIGRLPQRINQKALAEEERRPSARTSDADQWVLGPDQRTAGSLHTDIWEGGAADLAGRGALAIYPVAGWWKDNKARDRSDDGARYALIVSIETPGQDVDIWTPVAQQVGIPTVIQILESLRYSL
jgi:hypothetical protein